MKENVYSRAPVGRNEDNIIKFSKIDELNGGIRTDYRDERLMRNLRIMNVIRNKERRYGGERGSELEWHEKRTEGFIDRIELRKRELRLNVEENKSNQKESVGRDESAIERDLMEREGERVLQEDDDTNNITNDNGSNVNNNNSEGDNKRKRKDRRGGVKIRLLNAQALTEIKQLAIRSFLKIIKNIILFV